MRSPPNSDRVGSRGGGVECTVEGGSQAVGDAVEREERGREGAALAPARRVGNANHMAELDR